MSWIKKLLRPNYRERELQALALDRESKEICRPAMSIKGEVYHRMGHIGATLVTKIPAEGDPLYCKIGSRSYADEYMIHHEFLDFFIFARSVNMLVFMPKVTVDEVYIAGVKVNIELLSADSLIKLSGAVKDLQEQLTGDIKKESELLDQAVAGL